MKISVLGKQIEIKTEAVVISASVLALIGCLLGYILFKDNSDIIIESSAPSSVDEINSLEESTMGEETTDNGEMIEEAIEHIKVYIVGCVKNPGIVTIEKGQMICDAVQRAGGLTEEADPDSINMVYSLTENVMVYIKSKNELQEQESGGGLAAGPEGTKRKEAGKGALIAEDIGNSVALTGSKTEKAANIVKEEQGIINLNTAGANELKSLPGVGDVTAKAIIDFREKNGPFIKIEDIMKVPRIKQGRFDSIKDFITVN